MASSVHVVHTIHGTFSGISTYPINSPTQPSYSMYAGVATDMTDRQPPGLAKAAWRVAPVSIPSSCRRLPPTPDIRRQPPSRSTTAQLAHFPQEESNLLGDRLVLQAPPVQTKQIVSYQRTRLASQSFAVKIPRPSHLDALLRQRTAQRLAQDREAHCKVVAGILLNRVHAVGKPMRRAPPPNPEVPREYKRSCLSTMVTVDDL